MAYGLVLVLDVVTIYLPTVSCYHDTHLMLYY